MTKNAHTFAILAGPILLALAASTPGVGAPATNDPPIPVNEIITKFVDKETEFAKARENYTYRQTVKIYEYDDAGGVRGKYELIQDIIFTAAGKRTERVVFAPVATLRNIILTPEDMEDLRSVQPFVMTNAELPNYHVRYLGTERIDEIDCYVFAIKPKEMVKGERYFEGQAWVDQRDLQIVKTFGKGVGILKKKSDNQFPRFETYRLPVDGKYWFPVYTSADDILHFQSGDQRIKMIIKYEDYKQFKGTADIKFGDIVDDTGTTPGEKPDENPQIEPQK